MEVKSSSQSFHILSEQQQHLLTPQKKIKDKSITLVLKLINKVLAAYSNHNGYVN